MNDITLKIGQVITAPMNRELEGSFGSKRIVKKGTWAWVSADGAIYHLNDVIETPADGKFKELKDMTQRG